MSAGGTRIPALAALTRFWADDKGLSVFSGLLAVLVFVMPALEREGTGRSLAGDVLFCLLVVSGVQALGDRRLARLVLMPSALLAVAVQLGSYVVAVPETWLQATGFVSLLLLLVVVLGRTLREGPVTRHRLLGGIAAYLLLGIIWAYAYSVVALALPGAFSGPVHPGDGARAWFYFSFVTLTTVGYGDVQPVHPLARSLASMEAVTGSLYVAILIARLVSQTAAPAASTPAEASPQPRQGG